MKLVKIYFCCLFFVACSFVTTTKEFGTTLEERQKRKTYFQKRELTYDSGAFELVSPYPEDNRTVEFLFGEGLSKKSAYFQIEGQRLYSKKVGQEKVTARIFQDNQLIDQIETLLKVLPKKLAIRVRDRTAGLEELTKIPLSTEFVGLNLTLQAEPNQGINFYSYQPDSDSWQKNTGSFFCEKFIDRACSFAIKASEERTYTISIVADDENIVFDPPLNFNYAVGFSYPFFSLDSQDRLQSINPRSASIAANTVFSYAPTLVGLTIDEKTGELSFDTLASFAAAGGQSISISNGSKTVTVDLKIQAVNKEGLKKLIYLFIRDPGIGVTGNYNAIDTSQVEDMSSLFFDGEPDSNDILESFNGDIGAWDTFQVTDMSEMFRDLKFFNQDIGSWQTANVQNMSHMFFEAETFNQDIGAWNTKNVQNMSHMFLGATAFNRHIGDWDTQSVGNMSHMFCAARDFNQHIGNWQTQSVKNMQSMFAHTKFFNQHIGDWNTAKVNNMSRMFLNAEAFNQDIGSWDVSNVTTMAWMFAYTTAFNQSIGFWDTQNVEHMPWMFFQAGMFNQNIGGWDTGNVRNMYRMFKEAEAFNQDIGGWDTTKVTNMVEMFKGETVFNQDISGWDVQAAKNHRQFRYFGFWQDGLEGIFSGALAFHNQGTNTAKVEEYFRLLREAGGE